MKIQLVEIKFNHDTVSASADAYNIRRNETTPIIWPEWQEGRTTSHEDSLAAYSLSDTREKTLTIQARFRIDETDRTEVRIHAIDPNAEGSAVNVLGEVGENTVVFNEGESAFTLFELMNPSIWSAGVGIHDVVWNWEYRLDDSSSWDSFDQSLHRIYTTLSLPKDSWAGGPFHPSNTQLVWTDVLEWACKWATAMGSSEANEVEAADEVAAAVVREVFALGPQFIQFNDQNYGSALYTDASFFDCTAFLQRLSGNFGHGRFVNCTDCAAIVATFSNALGADLAQARMAPPSGVRGFALNPHLRIGMLKEIIESSFRYHEVAWKGSCREADDVFDACLLVNGSNSPVGFSGKAASNLPFGQLGDEHYRFRLVRSSSEQNCLPVEGSAVRRRLGPVPQALRRQPLPESFVLPAIQANQFVTRFSLSEARPSSFAVETIRENGPDSDVPVIRTFWKEYDGSPSVVCVDSYECSSRSAAVNAAWNLLDDFELPGMQQIENADPRLLEFSNNENSTALFAVANLVFLLRNVGSVIIPLAPLVTTIKEFVLQPVISKSMIAESAHSPFFIKQEGTIGQRLELERTSNGSDGPCWFFSDYGEVSREGGKLFYEPADTGDHTIHIRCTGPEGDVSGTRLRIRIS